MAAGKFYKALLELQTKIHHHISFFSSVVERGIAEMQIILRSLFRSREGAVLLHFLSLYLITARSIVTSCNYTYDKYEQNPQHIDQLFLFLTIVQKLFNANFTLCSLQTSRQ
jgi:hypothetical protein